MAYTEVTVIWDGAVDEHQSFGEGCGDLLQAFIDDVRQEAVAAIESDRALRVEVWVLYHAHNSGSECECAQYRTDGPDYGWVFATE